MKKFDYYAIVDECKKDMLNPRYWFNKVVDYDNLSLEDQKIVQEFVEHIFELGQKNSGE